MARKGQVEIVIILAILVVIVVVVATQMNLIIPPSDTPDVRTVRESAEGLVRTAVLDTIETMSNNGGYLSSSDYQMGSVRLNGQSVPYWQYRGQVTVPQKEQNLQRGVQKYLEDNKDSLAQALPGTEFGTPVVNIPAISNDRISISVSMPTRYNGAQIAQPYVVNVNTHFGEVYEFSQGFALQQRNERQFEYNTMFSFATSPIENNHHSIPLYEVMVGAGDTLFASSWEILPKAKTEVLDTLDHSYMPGKVPDRVKYDRCGHSGDTPHAHSQNEFLTCPHIHSDTSSQQFALTPISGKRYEELEVDFFLPDDFSFDYSNFRMSPDPVYAIAELIPYTGSYLSRDAVEVSYTMNYPVIVRATDPDTGLVFQYAIDVYIIDNQPAVWSAATALTNDDPVCTEASCLMEMTVTDSQGFPIEGAAVGFAGCFIGNTGSGGTLTNFVPCASGTLSIDHGNYGSLIESRTDSQLGGTEVLYRKPQVNVLLHEVKLVDNGGGNYIVYFGNVGTVTANNRISFSLTRQEDLEQFTFSPQGPSFTSKYAPAGNYYVQAYLQEFDASGTLRGGLVYPYVMSESDTTLHVYIPTLLGLRDIPTDEAKVAKIGELSQVLDLCGIGPVTTTEYIQEEACEVNV